MNPPTRGLPAGLRLALLAAIPVIAVGMLALGIWQLVRLQERRASNALISARLAAATVDVLAIDLAADPAAWEYRRARAAGEFDPAGEIVWRNQPRDGAPGVHVLTPLRLANGAAVLVDRGWIPYLQAEPAVRARYAPPLGPVEVEGVLRPPLTRSADFLPGDPTPAPGGPRLDAWLWTDLGAIQAQLPYRLLPVILVQSPGPGSPGLPAASSSVELSDGPHLGYAIQWFAFAAIAVFGPLAYWLRGRQERGRP